MKAWTDYPLIELGDTPGEIAPIRSVEILSYDGDKYCEVFVEGRIFSIKCGYLYERKSRCGEGFPISKEKLDALIEKGEEQ